MHCLHPVICAVCLLACCWAWLLASCNALLFLVLFIRVLVFEWSSKGTLILSKGTLIIQMEHSYYQKELKGILIMEHS